MSALWPSATRFALFLALVGLAGCGATAPVVRDLPPAPLLEPCPEPEAAFQTNGELAEYALALRGALRACNNDKAALREWAETP